MAQVALAWLRHQAVPVIPIIGARKVSQLQDNLASLDLELSAEQLKSLDGASRIETGFLRVFTREKWFVQLGMGGTFRIACSSKLRHFRQNSDAGVNANERDCSRVTG